MTLKPYGQIAELAAAWSESAKLRKLLDMSDFLRTELAAHRDRLIERAEAQEIDLASARAEIASLRSAIELVKWDCREEAENLAHSRAVRIAYSRVEEQINVILAAHPQTEQAEQVRDVLRDGLRNARLASPAPVTLAEQHARRRLGEWLAANPSRSWHWHGDDGQTQYTVVLYQYECSWAGSGNSLAEAIARALERRASQR